MSSRGSKRHHHGSSKPVRSSGAPDGAVYLGVVIICVFGLFLWSLVSPESWKHGLLGAVIAVALLVNMYGWQVFAGRKLANWQKALARLPLRCAGYGAKKGRPVESAKGAADAKLMLLITAAVSVLVILGLTLWLI